MHIHIATQGKAIEPVMKAINAIPGIDKLYLLYSSKFQLEAEKTKNVCESLRINTNLILINAFNFQDIVDSIYMIYHENYEKGIQFSINITGGTNLMAAAASSCAFFIGATIYYVHWDDEQPIKDQLEIIPAPHVPNLGAIGSGGENVLQYLIENTEPGKSLPLKSVYTYFKVDKQNSSYYIRKLEHEGLVEVKDGVLIPDKKNPGMMKIDSRQKSVIVTDQGRLIGGWLRR